MEPARDQSGASCHRVARLIRNRYAKWGSMNNGTSDETHEFWNRAADDWRIQVGDEGDANRQLNSDPVLWRFAGDVRGRVVLDAGCGTGYLSAQLHGCGARVIGVDFSERMIAIAHASNPDIDYRVDSCSQLATIGDEVCDLVIANYVLMDTPDLDGTMAAFNRVLKPNGLAVLVFSHPCFPQGRAAVGEDGISMSYRWAISYFEVTKCTDPPWAHFTTDFIWFHRPLSAYWKSFQEAGFTVVDFEEPRVSEDRFHLAKSEKVLRSSRTRPYSVAFKLQKTTAVSCIQPTR
jgi:SAM-dependent methyltransferase